MNTTVLGATGATGRILLPLLVADHQVTVLARRPQAVTVPRSKVAVITGDATSEPAVREAVRHADVVISLVGPSDGERADVRPQATRVLVGALQDVNPYARLVVVSALGGRASISQLPWFSRTYYRLTVGPHLLAGTDQLEGIVGDSGLAATIVRPSRLVDKPARGIRATYGPLPAVPVLHRADLARYLALSVDSRLPDLETVTVASTV